VDGVFHVAGWYKVGVKDEAAAVRTNVDGTRNVCETMRELGVPKGVYTSTLAVNSDTHGQLVDETYTFRGKHISVYDRTKAEAHVIVREFIDRGAPLVIVQPGLVYGPGDTSGVRTMLIDFLTRKIPVVPAKTALCWAYVDDVARGHVLAMERGQIGRSYFLAGPPHTLVEALDVASEITGIPPPRIHASPALMKAAAWSASLVERFVSLPPQYTAEGLRVVAGTTYLGTNARAARELGWTPRPLREGLRETLRAEMRALGMTANF
jgi:nucleoside-diphosphate-sugar epimerase